MKVATQAPGSAVGFVAEGKMRRPTKASEKAARRLAEQIVSQGLPPGTPLPTEAKMAESLGVGRGTMREALRTLETFGLIEIRTGRHGGPVVRIPDADDLSVSLTLAFFAMGASMLNVLDARMVLEPALVELAAARITSEELDALRATISEIRAPGATERTYLDSAERFHNLVAEAAHSPVLSYVSAGLHRIAGGEVVGIMYPERERLATATSHERITDALASGDGELAKDLWRAHLMDARRYWMQRFPENAKMPVKWTIGIDPTD
jgi:GntR family transcriptional regulator, transcriptional repressor for pyruvate dehydrogenase complex